MSFSRYSGLAALLAIASHSMTLAKHEPALMTELAPVSRPSRRKVRMATGAYQKIRSRNAKTRRAKRPNRLHVSRRVRRRHRRAA